MSASSKFDASSGALNRPLYASGFCASNGISSVGSSASFRENIEKSLMSSLQNKSRCSSPVTRGDVLNFFQCVRIDPKSMVVEHKLNRPAAFERLASASVGIPLEDSFPGSIKSKHRTSPSLEDLRRLKSGVRESVTKARERMKVFNECLSVVNKCFPTIPLRKRSRLDALSNERSNALLSNDQPSSGMCIGKMGLQTHASMNCFELESQKAEAKAKSAFPKKRTRDARMDVHANGPARPTGNADKEKYVVRLSNSSAAQGKDRALSLAVDGWENPKMKKKRTGAKLDVAASSVMTKTIDGFRESKQGINLQIHTDTCSRLTSAHGFRSGTVNGSIGAGKAEAISQTSSSIHSSISRTDSDNSSFLHERRDRPTDQEKKRVNLKTVNRANPREGFSSSSPTSGSKLNANVCAPGSGSVGAISKLSQVVQPPASPNEWELSSCANKIPGGFETNSSKRTASTGCSSPVANWVQRPQKISRSARRTNLLPIIPVNDENPVVDATADMMVNERCFLAHSPQQVKVNGANFSPAVLSESEESGAVQIKSKSKTRKHIELAKKSGQNVQKISSLLLPPQKNKAVNGNDHGDGIRRKGRTGRGVSSSRSLLPLSLEKFGNVGTTKQIRSSRLGCNKTEGPGRTPTIKLSDRKAYARQKNITYNTGAIFLAIDSDQGHDELLAAANAVTNTAQALSGVFWKKLEPLFRYTSDLDISYLKDQVCGSVVEVPAPLLVDADGYGSNELRKEDTEARSVELSPEHSLSGAKPPNEISLHQRLIAALIPEEGNRVLFCDGLKDDTYGPQYGMEKDTESDDFYSWISPIYDFSGYPTPNSYDVNSNGRSFYDLEHSVIPEIGIPNHDHLQNGSLMNQLVPGTVCPGYNYHSMSINERLALEVHSIGIYPELESGDEEINRDVSWLYEKYLEQVSKKKSLLGKLLSSVCKAKELQEKEFEEHALNKLVVMAYGNYMNCSGSNSQGIKNGSGKFAKKSALGFVKQALKQCQDFEVIAKSCFDDPMYREIFLAGVARLGGEQPLVFCPDSEPDKLQPGTSACSLEVRSSAPVGTQHGPASNNQETYSSEVLLANPGSEQNSVKEDSWSIRMRREFSLDHVGGMISRPVGVPSGLGGSLSCSPKGKRSGRDRDGKGNSRDVLSRSRTIKISCPASTSTKGEKKSKAKPRQKITHLPVSGYVPSENIPDKPKGMSLSTFEISEIGASNIGTDKNDSHTDMLEEPIDLSGLQLPDMDDLGVPDDLGGQGDIGSWLDIEDDGLHDQDFMGGLETPTDDLVNLSMMF